MNYMQESNYIPIHKVREKTPRREGENDLFILKRCPPLKTDVEHFCHPALKPALLFVVTHRTLDKSLREVVHSGLKAAIQAFALDVHR